MNGCEKCLAYKIQNGMAEKEICRTCFKRTLAWKPEFYLECPKCGGIVGVDFNSACEMDPLFKLNPLLILRSQTLPRNEVIIEMAKILNLNALQMRQKLQEGYSVEIDYSDYDRLVQILDENNIDYRFDNVVDLRKKYTFYKECKYPYSRMRRYL